MYTMLKVDILFTIGKTNSMRAVYPKLTSQMIHHPGVSLSKQHMTDVLFCHWHWISGVYAQPLPEAISTWHV